MATRMCLFLHLTLTVSFMKVISSPLPEGGKNTGCDMPSFREAEYYGFPIPHKLQTNVKIPFRCKEAYYDTPTYTICYGGNNWEALDPPCKLVKCELPPQPMFGVVRAEGQGYRGKASYSCDEGYQYTGTTERTCQRNGQWSGLEGHCNKIQCIQPLLPHGSFTKGSVFGYKNKTVAVCEPGYKYNGSKEHVCLEDNRWSGTIGWCVETRSVRCPPFPDLTHLVVPPAIHGGKYQDIVHLSCDPGFVYSGATSRECLLNNTWSGQDGQCQEVFCEPPKKLVQNGYVVDSCEQCAYKHVLQITCHPGYSYNGSVLTCTGEGHWNGSVGHCNVVRCNTSLQVNNADVNKTGTVYKSTAIVSCHSGYTLVGNDVLQCRANGQWDKPGVCSVSTVNQGGVAAGVVVSLMVVITVVLGIVGYIYKKRHSIDPVTEELKTIIRSKGHLIFRPQDKRIHLSTEFVEPRIVVGQKDDEDFINAFRYDQYQKKQQKTGVNLKDLIEGTQSGKTTIIYGRGCVGKSVLVEYTFRQWAVDEWSKDDVAFFLMNMRNPKLDDSKELTLVEFLHQFTIHELKHAVKKKWLKKNEENITFFVDAVDALQDRQNEYKQVKPLSEEDMAKPFDWCVNILRRAVLKKTRMFLSTRLFDWLNDIHSDKQYEIIGLTKEGVIKMIEKHVKAEKHEQVKLIILNNPVLFSVSAITFFCLKLCKALQEEEHHRDDPNDLCTTTRIIAFIIDKYLERLGQKPTIFDEQEETEETALLDQPTTSTTTRGEECVAPLAKLAFSVIHARRNADLAHLKFYQTQLEKANCTKEIVKVSCQLGLVYSRTEGDKGTSVQFLHISIQQLLSMLELLTEFPDSRNEVIKDIWSSKELMQYLFGLMYDTKYKPVALLRQLVGLKDEEDYEVFLNSLLEHLAMAFSDDHLHAVQIAYETQNSEVANHVAAKCFKETGTLSFTKNKQEELTDLDMKSIMFMIKHCPALHTLKLTNVILYETTQKQLGSSLSENTNLKHLQLTGVHLSKEGVKSISESLKINQSLQSLSIDMGDIDDDKMGFLAEALKENKSLEELSFHTNDFGNKGMVTLTSSLIKNTGVKSVRFSERRMDGSQKDLVEKVNKQRPTDRPIEFKFE